MRPLLLKTQTEVLDDIEAAIGDTGNTRWAAADIYRAINVALRGWHGRVFVPQVYDMPSGFTSGVYEYSIPSYVGDQFAPYIRSSVGDESGETWAPLTSWTVDPDGSGGRTLRLYIPPYAEDGRLIWYSQNGPVPTTVPTLSDTITSAATSLVLASALPQLAEAGYVKAESEWIGYAGVTRGSATTTLSNLSRGVANTTAASHNAAVSVNVGIAADADSLWTQLEYAAIARLHFILLHRGTTEDRSQHEKMMSWAADQASRFWRQEGYVPYRKTRIKPAGWWR